MGPQDVPPLTGVFAALACLAGVLVAAVPTQATAAVDEGPPLALPGNAAPRLPAGAVRLGSLPAAATVSLDVTLNLPDQARLTAFLAGLSDRASPLFHHFLLPGQFGPMFGPSLAQVAAVDNALRSAGLSPGPVSANRLAIPVTATAAAVQRAFGIDLVRYRLPGGRIAYANSAAPRLPAAIAPLVTGVLGLDNLYPQQSLAARQNGPAPVAPAAPGQSTAPGTSGPQPCAGAKAAASSDDGFTANELAAHYGMTPLYRLGDLGQGVHVALIELEPDAASDIKGYETCYGIATKVTYTKVDGGVISGTGGGEAALDIEDVAGLAPDATIDVYQAPAADKNVYDDYSAIVTAKHPDQVISTSWGLCEAVSTKADVISLGNLFKQANVQGETVFAAAGDAGSTDCLNTGPVRDALDADTPATSPFVIAVGGTKIGSAAETVWNESANFDGAGGGGISSIWCMPGYQYRPAIPGLVNAGSKTSPACQKAGAHGYLRQVPDVAADADPFSGYVIMFDGVWEVTGGTSAAAPLWAAVAALTDASPFCADYASGDPGVLPEGLYAGVASNPAGVYPTGKSKVRLVLSDITSGTNDYTPSGYTGGLYPATRGYDEASGLGVPLVTGKNGPDLSVFYPGVAALMCRFYATRLRTVHVTSVTPSRGPAGHSATVTVHGSGFLPIAGADMALISGALISGGLISGKLLAAHCPTTTTCTFTVPAMAAGTVNVQLSAEDRPSPVTKADRYRYVAAPGVSSLSPDRGPARGGTKVTIHGTNFIGVTSVHFGTRLATHVTAVSATEITVTAPAGSGTVHVTITAAGGTSSAKTTASEYRYT